MTLHHLTITMSGLHGSEIHDAHAVIVSVVHHHNASHIMPDNKPDYQNRVAIAFPEYREGVETDASKASSYGEEQRLVRARKGFMGRVIRLFGEAHHLQSILTHPDCAFLNDTPGIIVDTVSVVPQSVGCVAFQRRKGMTNATPSRLRRAMERQKIGKSLSNLTACQMERLFRNKQQAARKDSRFPNVSVWSVSNGSQFSVFIERTETDVLRFAPDGYGFSSNTEVCSLPVF